MSIQSNNLRASIQSHMNSEQSKLDANPEHSQSRIKACRKLLACDDSALGMIVVPADVLLANVKAFDRTADLLRNFSGSSSANRELFRATLTAIGSDAKDHTRVVAHVKREFDYTPTSAQARTFNAVSALRFVGVLDCSESDRWTKYDKSCLWTIKSTKHAEKILSKLR